MAGDGGASLGSGLGQPLSDTHAANLPGFTDEFDGPVVLKTRSYARLLYTRKPSASGSRVTCRRRKRRY